MTIRVLVVDDSALIRSVLSRAPAADRQADGTLPDPLHYCFVTHAKSGKNYGKCREIKTANATD